MIALIGLLVVVGSVIGGFTLAGGKVMALFHLSEFIVIGGTAVGTVLISTPGSVLKAMTGKLTRVAKSSPFHKSLYLEALKLLFELFQVARRDGLVAIEAHIEAPGKSAVFKKYPGVLHQHHAVTFLCDSLRLVLVGSVPPFDLETLMENEIDVHHEQEAMPVATLQKVGDSLPGIGIVAAVLGIVVTMSAIAGPVEQVGEHVAAALTGTFLGVLLAYGFASPLATSLEHSNTAETRFYHFIKASVVAFAKGFSPLVAVEFARRSIFTADRPTFAEMESAVKSLKAKPGAAA
ncbi:MAG: flagellar motor stator protein MotA [Gemmatimonadales bacterium]